jgi:integrase/recombinase XerD
MPELVTLGPWLRRFLVEHIVTERIHGHSGDHAAFVSRLGTPFTRFGVYRLIERCAARVPKLAERTITPHVIRHTTACHLVLSGVDINTIRAWLGHVSISTTNIYAEIDLTLKANAVALCEVPATTGSLTQGGQRSHGFSEIQ